MRSTWKRTLSALLTIAMIATLLVVPVSAAGVTGTGTKTVATNFGEGIPSDTIFSFSATGTGAKGTAPTIGEGDAAITPTKAYKLSAKAATNLTFNAEGTGKLKLIVTAGSTTKNKVALTLDDVEYTPTSSPISISADNASAQTVELPVSATDDKNHTLTSKAGDTSTDMYVWYVEFIADPAGPSITANEPAVVTISANASDADHTKELSVTVENSEEAVTWSSSDTSKVTVEVNATDDKKATITGVAVTEENAPVTITATLGSGAGAISDTFDVTVVAGMTAVESITVDPTSYTMTEGGTVALSTFHTTVKPDGATDKTVYWSVDDSGVIELGDDKNIKALKPGTATLTAKAGDQTADVTITVTAKPRVWVGYDELKTAMGDLSGCTVTTGSPSGWISGANFGKSDNAAYLIKGAAKAAKYNVIKVNSTTGVTFTPDIDGTLTLVLAGVKHADNITISNAQGSPFTGTEGCQEIIFPVTAGTAYAVEPTANVFIHAAVLHPGTFTCSHTSYGTPAEHTAATCGVNQTTIKWCSESLCFHSVIEEVADSATGAHTFNENKWEETTAATDDADGLKTQICDVCGKPADPAVTEVVPKLSHKATISATNGTVALTGTGVTDNGDGTYKIKNDASVTVTATPAEGYEGGTVKVMNGSEEVPVTGGVFTMPAADVTVTATFTKKAPVITLSAEEVHVNADASNPAHTKEVTVTVENAELTDVSVTSADTSKVTVVYDNTTGKITVTGVAATEGDATVTVTVKVGEVEKTFTVDVAAAGAHTHHYEVTSTTPATCTTAGKKVETCDNTDGKCDQVTKETVLEIDPDAHPEGSVAADPSTAKAATCTEPGKEADTVCAACKATVTTGATIPALGHKFVDDEGNQLAECANGCGTANPNGPMWTLDYDVTETLGEGTTIAGGTVVDTVAGIKLTYGSGTYTKQTSASAGNEGALVTESGMQAMVKGSEAPAAANNIPTSGTYYKFEATKNGTLLVAYGAFSGKDVVVSEQAAGAATATLVEGAGGHMDANKNVGDEFAVKAGNTYYVYAGGSKLCLYGFSFEEGTTPPPAPETKTVTFQMVGTGASVTDVKVDGTVTALTDSKLVDIAKEAVVTFKVTVTDAAKVLKSVTGATFADGIYTVTADTVVITTANADGTVTEHTVTIVNATNGKVEADKTTVTDGQSVTLTVTPDTGYELDQLMVDGAAVTVTGSTYTFVPTKDVTVSATFKKTGGGDEPGPGPDVPAALTGKYVFDATKIAVTAASTAVTNDMVKAATTVTTTDAKPVEAMFTVEGTVTTKWETPAEAPAFAGAVELAKKEQGKIIFTIPEGSKATVTVGASSTNKTNESAYAMKKDGAVVANDGELVSIVAGNTKTEIVYTDLGPGTYEIVSPEDADRSRGMRIWSVEVNFDGADEPGPDVPGPGPVDPEKPADKTALNGVIADANDLAGTYTVRPDTTVASNVKEGTQYVLEKDKKALDEAVEAAKAVAAKTDATQDEVDAAVKALNDAMDAFNAAVKTGTKTSGGSGNHSSSARPGDRGGVTTTTETKTNDDGSKVKTEKSSDGAVKITATDPSGEVIAEVSIPATIPSVGYKFVDVPDDHWAAKSINEMAGLGMVKGVDDVNHVYDMNSNITRGAVATILFRLSNGKTGMENIFSDVTADAWYADGIAWANKAGVVKGFEDGTYGPDSAITREQLAVMIARYATLIGLDTTASNGELGVFTDAASIQSWATESMAWCVSKGIINGKGNGVLDPSASASRAEAATMFDRFINLVK